MSLSGNIRASAVALCLVMLTVSGCKSHRTRTPQQSSPEALYKKAKKSLDGFDFNGAIKMYESLTARFPLYAWKLEKVGA